MSTRANILVREHNEQCYVYHHCDGYPSGVGIDLKKYLATVRYWYCEDIVNDLIKGEKLNDNGYEWTSCVHGDEQYFYLIDCDKKELHCYEDKAFNSEVEIKEDS